MNRTIEREWKSRLMPDAQLIYDTLPRNTGSTLVRMVTAQFVTERALYSAQGGQYSLRAERGYALEPLSTSNHMDMMGIDEHTWRVLGRTPPYIGNMVPGITACLAQCEGNAELKQLVQELYAR